MTASYDWIFWLVGGLLSAFALWLFYWSLLHDRSRGRQRCPKCWYDMSGTPGNFTCSECGHSVKREKKLFKTRRRWRWLVASGLLFIIAGSVAIQPRVQRNGFMSVIPTTVLIVLLPVTQNSHALNNWRTQLCDELILQRLHIVQGPGLRTKAQLWNWQWKWVINRSLATLVQREPSTIDYWDTDRQILQAALQQDALYRLGYTADHWRGDYTYVKMPNTWPDDLPVPFSIVVPDPANATIIVHTGNPSTPLNWHQSVPPPELASFDTIFGTIPEEQVNGPTTFVFDVAVRMPVRQPTGKVVWLPIWRQLTAARSPTSRNNSLPAADSSIDQLVRDGFRLRFDAKTSVIRAQLSEECIIELRHIGMIACLQIFHGKQIVFSKKESFEIEREQQSQHFATATFHLSGLPAEVAQGSTPDDGSWSIRFTVDPEETQIWGLFDSRWYCTSYWDGAIEQTVDWKTIQAAPMR